MAVGLTVMGYEFRLMDADASLIGVDPTVDTHIHTNTIRPSQLSHRIIIVYSFCCPSCG